MKIRFAITVLFACSATAARAQEPVVHPMPAVGERIRVTPAEGEPFTGSLAALGGDTILLAREGDSAVTIRVSQQPVDVLRRHREAWSGLGALAGVAAGIAASQVLSGSGGGVKIASHAVVGGAAGALVGGLLGFSVAPRRWQRLTVVAPRYLPPPPAAQAPADFATTPGDSTATPAPPAAEPPAVPAPAPPAPPPPPGAAPI